MYIKAQETKSNVVHVLCLLRWKIILPAQIKLFLFQESFIKIIGGYLFILCEWQTTKAGNNSATQFSGNDLYKCSNMHLF